MLRKIWAIAYINIYQTFTDRNLILIMIVTPLILATIISLAFGNLGSGSSPISDIPVALVNLDEGAPGFNGGQIMAAAFAPDADAEPAASGGSADCPAEPGEAPAPPMSLTELINATLLDDPAAAKAGVDSGDYAAAVIIPADFSQKMSYGLMNPVEISSIEVYGSSARPISASIIRSVVEGFANQLLTGFVAAQATIETVGRQFGFASIGAVASSPEFAQAVACAAGRSVVSIQQQTVTGEQVQFNPLVVFGSAQAVFFALFTANATAATILEDRRNWTLQRLMISPTPRVVILLGKLISTVFTVLIQLVFLFIGFTVIGSLLQGRVELIWGSNILAIGLLLVATTLATAGVGMITAAVGRTPEQANIIGSIVSMLMGILGGAFFAVGVLGDFEFITRISVVRWGSEGFSKLAAGQSDVLGNVAFLVLLGAVFFGISLWIFNRRKDV